MIRSMVGTTLALVLLLGGSDAAAQQRQVSGRITNAVTGDPIAGATATVVGSAIAAVSNATGEFTLSGPDGAFSLLVRAVGFKRRLVPVPGDQTSVSLTLDPDIFNLEAVVVTGQATGVEQRNLANAVASVTAEQLGRAPTSTLEGALQGKIPGALIQANSGAPGGGFQLNLRGVSTINGSVNPLIVVDGLVISNSAIPNGMNAVTASQAGGNPSNQDDAVNRIADLNPADIERVEVLKGASAAAIYGSKATNGVIVITTRRGQSGATRFRLTQRLGAFQLANKMGTRRFTDAAEAVAAFGASAASFCTVGGTGCPFYDNEELLYGQSPLSSETQASMSGGNDQTTFFVSGLLKDDGGIAVNTGYKKQSLRANLDQRMSPRVSVSVNTNLVHSLAQRGISNNDNAGTSPYLVFPFTPSFVNLQATGPLVTDYPDNPFERSNPLQTEQFLKNDEDVWRFLGTSTLRYALVTSAQHNLQVIATGGVDYFQQQNEFYSPPELEFEPNDGQPGTIVLGKAANTNLNLGANITHTFSPAGGGLLATTSAGFQYESRHLNFTSLLARTLLPGQENPDEAASITPFQEVQPVRDLGLYAQEEVLAMNERLLLTLGVRADRSSANGDVGKYYLFPKAAASYRMVRSGGDELKLRGAVGQTGNQPVFAAKYTYDTTGAINGQFGLLVGTRVGVRIGDPNIRPERQTEFEGGFDATMGGGRANVSLTVYQKTVSDLLLEQTLRSSSGLLTYGFNGGKLRNRGVEIAVGISPFQRAELNWIMRSTFFLNRSEILELPAGIDSFLTTAGFSRSLGAYQIQLGRSATQIVGSEGVVGEANPDFTMSFSSDLDYRAFSLGMLWDWKKGGDVINLTQLLFDAGQTSPDYVAAGADRITAWATGTTGVYVQDGSYLKLREVTLSYRLPSRATASLFGSLVQSARLSVSGRNLLRFASYPGLDPEVSNFGNQAVARNIDVAPFPPARSFFFTIDLDF